MIRIYVFFIAVFVLLANNPAQAQGRKKRFVNFKVELDRFNEGDTFYTPGNIFCRMYIINMGPDTVFKGDMLHLEYKFGGYYYNPTFPPSPKTFGKGDTLVYSKYISSNGYQNAFNIPFCGFSRLAKVYNGDSLIYETPIQEEDNWSCMKASHIALLSTHKTVKNTLKVYPNPCSDFLYLAGKKNSQLFVFTIDGRKLSVHPTSHNTGTGDIEFDMRFLPAGLYLLEYEGKTCKLIKN